MEILEERVAGQTSEILELRRRVLTAEQELDRCRVTEERFRLFIDNVRDYALVPVDTTGKVSGWTRARKERLVTPSRRLSASRLIYSSRQRTG